MSQNIYQIYQANPITTNASTDLMYFGQSPYGAGDDAAMTFANFNAQIVATGTINAIGYYAAAGNKISPITTASNGVLITNNSGVPSYLANSGTPGFVLTANSGAPPSWQAVSASGAITTINGDSGSVTPSSGTVTINGGSTGLTTSGSGSTLSLTGTLIVANGGSGRATATAYALLAGGTTATGIQQSLSTGTTGQLLQSGGASALPSWTTATFPGTAGSAGTILRSDGTNWVASTATFADTYAVSTILYAGSSNAVSGLATTNRAALATNATGVPQWLALTDGQIVIGSTAGAPAAATLTGGTGITITNASNSITIDADAGGLEWSGVAGTSQAAAVDSGYVIQNAGATTVTLPATADLGSTIAIQGLGAGGWIMTANTGQTIQVGSSATSSGGTVTSANQWDSIVVVCVVANTTWAMQSSVTAGFTIA